MLSLNRSPDSAARLLTNTPQFPQLIDCLHRLKASDEHIEIAAQLVSDRKRAPQKFAVQIARVLSGLGALPEIGVFRAVCRLINERVTFLPGFGAEELLQLSRGYIAFLSKDPSSSLVRSVDAFLRSCSEKGLPVGPISKKLKFIATLANAGSLSEQALSQSLADESQLLSNKYPQRVAGSLTRRLGREVVIALEKQSQATEPAIVEVFGQEFAMALRMLRIARGELRAAGLYALGVIVNSDVDSIESTRGLSLHWGIEGFRALTLLAEALYEGTTTGGASAQRLANTLWLIKSLGDFNELLTDRTQEISFESWLRRSAIAEETGGRASWSRGSIPINGSGVLTALNSIFDIAGGYDVIRGQLVGGLGTNLSPSLLGRFGVEASLAVLPIPQAQGDAPLMKGLILKGLRPEIFLREGSWSRAGGDEICDAAEDFGEAVQLSEKAVYFFGPEYFGVLAPRDLRNRINGRNYGLVVSAPKDQAISALLVSTKLLIERLGQGASLVSIISSTERIEIVRDGQLLGAALSAEVVDALRFYHDFLELFRLRLALWHKGVSAEPLDQCLRSAASIRMLEECFALHDIGRLVGASKKDYPLLVLGSAFEYRTQLPSPFAIDTETLNLNVDGQSFQLDRRGSRIGSQAFVLWHRYVVPYLSGIANDLRFKN